MQPFTQETYTFDCSTPCASHAYRLEKFPKGHKNIINDCEISLIMPDDSMVDSGILQNDTLVLNPNQKAREGDIVAAIVSERILVRRYFETGNSVCLASNNVDIASTEISQENCQLCGVVTQIIPRMTR